MNEARIDSFEAQNVGMLVSSCDKYRDLWKPFFTLLWRYWPDCPFPIYLMTNHTKYEDERVTCLTVGEDRQWASNCRVALAQMPFRYILYTEEENLFRHRVSTQRVLSLFNKMVHYHAGCLRLYPSPGPDTPFPGDTDVGLISPGAPYRVALQAAFWEKKILESLLVDGETGWDMEIKGLSSL